MPLALLHLKESRKFMNNNDTSLSSTEVLGVGDDSFQHPLTCARWVQYDHNHKRYDAALECSCGPAADSPTQPTPPTSQQDAAEVLHGTDESETERAIRERRAKVRQSLRVSERLRNCRTIYKLVDGAEMEHAEVVGGDEAQFFANAPADIDHLLTLVSQLRAENARLRSGSFTPAELQNLCHNLPETDKEAFFAGCAEYQQRLFGESAVDQLRGQVAALEAEREWQPIETAPKDGTWQVVARLNQDNVTPTWWERASWIEKRSQWSSSGGVCKPTHWMPLPSQPTSKDERGE